MRKIKNIGTLSIFIFVLVVIGGTAFFWIYQSPKRTLEKQIIAMQGSMININFENAKSFIERKDTTFLPLPVKKVIVFVDSTSCSSCFIGKLVEYIDLNDSLSSKNSQLIVILHPRNSQQSKVLTRLTSERFPFWCIVDIEGEFITNNTTIPSNQLLHTFTLNEKDEVILVGDPTRNKKIKYLLMKELE